jgi:hypothetical protein
VTDRQNRRPGPWADQLLDVLLCLEIALLAIVLTPVAYAVRATAVNLPEVTSQTTVYAAGSSASHALLLRHVRADTSNLRACRDAAGTLAQSCVMSPSASREATLESVLLLVSCTLILLGIVSAFF